MEIHITPSIESRLQELSARTGRSAEALVEDALASYLAEQTRFINAVQRGIAAADRGELIAHDEVVAHIEARLAK